MFYSLLILLPEISFENQPTHTINTRGRERAPLFNIRSAALEERKKTNTMNKQSK